MRRTFGEILKKAISVQFPINNSYECFFLYNLYFSRDSQTYILSIMCDIEVFAIEMYINLKHKDADKRGDFINFINC